VTVKILLVEDNPQDQKIIARYLQRAGFRIFLLRKMVSADWN